MELIYGLALGAILGFLSWRLARHGYAPKRGAWIQERHRLMQYYIVTDDTAIGPFVSRVVASKVATTDLAHYLTEERYEIKHLVFVKYDSIKGTLDWPVPRG